MMVDRTDAQQAATLSAVTWRLVPFMMLLYFIAYVDRINVGFAALTMNADLGFSATAYGLGAGMFFIGYVLFEIPSNVLMHKLGARIWIARIMITWGIFSGGMAFVTGTTSFYVMRFLLGAAEAGFFPGMILYLTYWFPANVRVKVIGLFMVAAPLSTLVGAPVSAALLGLDWLGLKGWQWLFLLEALPALGLGAIALFYLTDRPEDAHWLSDGQREWLTQVMNRERQTIQTESGHPSLGSSLRDRRVLGFGLVYFGIVTGSYTLGFWLPQIIKSLGSLSIMQVGLVTALINAFAVVAMILWTRRSDARGERVGHFVAAAIVAAIAFAAFAYLQTFPFYAVAALTFAAMGIYAALPTFWGLPTSFLTGVGAAGGIALINSMGNAAGYVAPFAVGYLKDATGEISAGLLAISLVLVLAAILAVILVRTMQPSVVGSKRMAAVAIYPPRD